MHKEKNEIKLILAPLQGLSERVMRNAWHKHFSGFDYAVSPFIPMVEGLKINPKVVKDVDPKYEQGMNVIPQLLGNNPEHFVNMCTHLYSLGYKQIDWNLGCSVKTVVKHKRGSGLMMDPERVRSILDFVIPKIPNSLSIKLRLGYKSKKEIFTLIEVLNDYPLQNICIHPRLGIDLYEGEVDIESFSAAYQLSKHKIIWSGDIKSKNDYDKVISLFPDLDAVMIGREAIKDPFIAQKIKGELFENINKFDLFQLYHFDIIDGLIDRNIKPKQIAGKIKEFWKYWRYNFEDGKAFFSHMSQIENYEDLIEECRKYFENKSKMLI